MYKTMEQIEKEYDGQWVFMINCQSNERGTVLGGEVVLHSDKKNDVIGKTREVNNKTSLTFTGYIGKIPEGVAFL